MNTLYPVGTKLYSKHGVCYAIEITGVNALTYEYRVIRADVSFLIGTSEHNHDEIHENYCTIDTYRARTL